MALAFNETDDRIAVTAAVSINDLDPFTYLAWLSHDTSGSFDRVIAKGANEEKDLRLHNPEIQFAVLQTTNPLSYITSDTAAPTGVWTCIAATYDNGATPRAHIYHGSLTAIVIEAASYSTSDDGIGTPTTESGNMTIGNRLDFTRGMDGRIAIIQVVDRALTLAEIRSWQFRPRFLSGTKLLHYPGLNGTGTQPDLSGNNNSGTTGGTNIAVAAHVPLGPPFGFDDLGIALAAGGDPDYEQVAFRFRNDDGPLTEPV